MNKSNKSIRTDKFIYEIPFTKSGKTHGDMAEQYKLRTIVTVEASFPHIRKRLRVVDRMEIEVTLLKQQK